MAGWMRLVTPVLIDAFPDQIINIHPSLLPSFRVRSRAGFVNWGENHWLYCSYRVFSGQRSDFAPGSCAGFARRYTRNASCPNSSPGTPNFAASDLLAAGIKTHGEKMRIAIANTNTV